MKYISPPNVPSPYTVCPRWNLGETGPLSQGVQEGGKALRMRYINGMEVCKQRPRGFKKRTRGFK